MASLGTQPPDPPASVSGKTDSRSSPRGAQLGNIQTKNGVKGQRTWPSEMASF